MKYKAWTDINLEYVGGTGYALPALVRQYRDKQGRRCTEFLAHYSQNWAARLAAWTLNFLARWEVDELPDPNIKQPPLTQEDIEWAVKHAKE